MNSVPIGGSTYFDFYFFYGSIHSYLSVMRIETLAAAAHVQVRWIASARLWP